jgi:hypothetical protein
LLPFLIGYEQPVLPKERFAVLGHLFAWDVVKLPDPFHDLVGYLFFVCEVQAENIL